MSFSLTKLITFQTGVRSRICGLTVLQEPVWHLFRCFSDQEGRGRAGEGGGVGRAGEGKGESIPSQEGESDLAVDRGGSQAIVSLGEHECQPGTARVEG